MNYQDALLYTKSNTSPGTISCRDFTDFSYHYEQEPGTSIVLEVNSFPYYKIMWCWQHFTDHSNRIGMWFVENWIAFWIWHSIVLCFFFVSFRPSINSNTPCAQSHTHTHRQWDLICEKSFWRTTVATAVSIGKFLGATTFGILSDKYGRKTCFIIGSIFYITGSVLTTFSPWYWLFLIGRVFLGSSSSGLFYPAFSLCKYRMKWSSFKEQTQPHNFTFMFLFSQ